MLYPLLYIVILNVVYVFGYFLFAILLKVKEAHYFLGSGNQLFSFRIANTQFSVGRYIPIVGLANIYTIIDGTRQRTKYPWEFFEQSIGRRLMVTLGGAVAVFVFGLLTSIVVTYVTTEKIITKEEVNRYGIYPSPQAREWGFEKGDKIVAINGKDYDDYTDLISPDEIVNPNIYYTVERNGKKMDIKPAKLMETFSYRDQLFISLYAPFEVDIVKPKSAAEAAGILPGDKITMVNGQPIVKFTEMNDAFKNDEDGMVSLELQRVGPDSIKTWIVNVELDSEKKIGLVAKELIQYTERKNTLFEAIQKGTYRSFSWMSSNFRGVFKAITGQLNAVKSPGGPIRISATENTFWSFAGALGMWYALWNLLPLPKAAFWEIIALVYERVTGRKYSYSTFQKTLILSWVIPIGLMIWMFTSDIRKVMAP
jgi:regulator of sigma E protease